ncbi:MAG: hypothetical protein RMJ67_08835 [Elusimicrobiota bacterium]|nr:hypothetical protein [Endomicrobiia bacterium]MCX7910758.1 hypothetical protein [Endomicrobiia bacterium]MDW8166601.1 hypothetical protein [Elusimicrobiota bacterium]
MIKIISLLLVICLLISFNRASEDIIRQALEDAHRDVKRNFKEDVWVAVGFFGNIFGVLFAYFYSPKIPVSSLMGKSPEYVSVYIENYKEFYKNLRLKSSLLGFGVSSLLLIAVVSSKSVFSLSYSGCGNIQLNGCSSGGEFSGCSSLNGSFSGCSSSCGGGGCSGGGVSGGGGGCSSGVLGGAYKW